MKKEYRFVEGRIAQDQWRSEVKQLAADGWLVIKVSLISLSNGPMVMVTMEREVKDKNATSE